MTGTHDAGTWEILRQVVIGARDLDKTGQQLREALNLAPGFADPLLEDIGLADETLAVGPQAFLEIVAPLDETVSLARWIRKGGGEGGYALSIQVSNIEPYLERATAADVRTVADLEAYGHRIVQLHPGDLGLLVELDEIPDADEWFWDQTEKEVSSIHGSTTFSASTCPLPIRPRRRRCGPKCSARNWIRRNHSRLRWGRAPCRSFRASGRCSVRSIWRRRSERTPSSPA